MWPSRTNRHFRVLRHPFHLRAQRLGEGSGTAARKKPFARSASALMIAFFNLVPLAGKAALHRLIRHQPAHQRRQLRLDQRLFHAALADQRQQYARRRAATMPAGPALTIATPPPRTGSRRRPPAPRPSVRRGYPCPSRPAARLHAGKPRVHLRPGQAHPLRRHACHTQTSSARFPACASAHQPRLQFAPDAVAERVPGKRFEIFRSTFLFSASMVSTPPLRQSRTASERALLRDVKQRPGHRLV